MGLTIEQLGLVKSVEEKARKLQALAPGVVFVSGRRTLTQQAHAMASSVAVKRSFIRETYLPSVASHLCQQWVDQHPAAMSFDELTNGLLSVLVTLTPRQQDQISRHLSGRAFDIRPGSATVAQVLSVRPKLFLMHESSLQRWHCQW